MDTSHITSSRSRWPLWLAALAAAAALGAGAYAGVASDTAGSGQEAGRSWSIVQQHTQTAMVASTVGRSWA